MNQSIALFPAVKTMNSQTCDTNSQQKKESKVTASSEGTKVSVAVFNDGEEIDLLRAFKRHSNIPFFICKSTIRKRAVPIGN